MAYRSRAHTAVRTMLFFCDETRNLEEEDFELRFGEKGGGAVAAAQLAPRGFDCITVYDIKSSGSARKYHMM